MYVRWRLTKKLTQPGDDPEEYEADQMTNAAGMLKEEEKHQ